MTRLGMPETIEIIMMSIAALILLVGKANVVEAVNGGWNGSRGFVRKR